MVGSSVASDTSSPSSSMHGVMRSNSSTSNNGSISPSDALMVLLSPDGYYHYLNVNKHSPAALLSEQQGVSNNAGAVPDEDVIKKNYRKLSLKHHPDKPGGDVETFRMLNRAQRVLLHPKLRQQYDILGIDLDDDEDEHADHVHNNNNNTPGKGDGHGDPDEHDQQQHSSTAQGIVQEIASMVLASLLQLTVRTVMMGAVAVLVVRYRWTLYPALAFLSYVAYHILQRARLAAPATTMGLSSAVDVLSPLFIAAGLLMMHYGRRSNNITMLDAAGDPSSNGSSSSGGTYTTWMFWWGESIVIFMFTYNSIASQLPKQAWIYGIMAALSMITALWFRGNVWNYATVVFFEAILALLVALAFPVMELVLEAILNEKLRKVGDKVRHHHVVLEKYYQAKLLQQQHYEKR